MKKTYKILLTAAAVLIVLVIAAAIAAPPLAKRYIEKHDRELLGRSIRMERLRANIFTGRLRVEGLRIGGAEDSTTFFSLDSFDMRLRLWPLLTRRVDVRHLRLAGPDLKVYQRGSAFSFDDIIAHFAGDTTALAAPAEPSAPWEIGIYNISIHNGHIFYKDLMLDATWGLNDINLQIPGVYFAGAKTDVGAVLNFAEGGSLATKVAYDIPTSAFDIGIKLNNLALANTLPYFRQSLDISGVEGLLSADISLHGDAEHLLSLRAEGTASLAYFALRDARQRTVAGVDSLGIRLAEGDLGKMRFRFDRIYLAGPSALFEMTPEGNNLSALMKAEATPAPTETPAATTPAGPDPVLQIADLEITGGRIALHDLSLERPFEYTVSDICMRSRGFNPATRNKLVIDARMQKTGSAKFRWEGTLNDLNNQSITLWLTNLDLRDFTPYCEHFTAYPVTGGNLTFRSQNVIRNRNLDGTNHLDVFEPKVDKKRKDLKPEMNIPLKLGLYVLKDKKGHVKMDLPVKGSLDSPEFSYRKIVMKAIGNVLLKVVTAPFSFLSGNKDNLEYIGIDPQQYAFTSEQYASLDRLAQALQDKPEMQIALTQRINLRRALPRQAANALRMAYAEHLRAAASADSAAAVHPGADSLTAVPAVPAAAMEASAVAAAVPAVPAPKTDTTAVTASSVPSAQAAASRPQFTMLEYEKIMQTDIRTPQIMAFADSLLAQRGITAQGMSAEQKATALFSEQAAAQLARMMAARDKAVTEYMLATHQAAAPAFRVQAADSAALTAYTGHDRYTISIGVDGETVEVRAEDAPTATEDAATTEDAAAGNLPAANGTAGTTAPDATISAPAVRAPSSNAATPAPAAESAPAGTTPGEPASGETTPAGASAAPATTAAAK